MGASAPSSSHLSSASGVIETSAVYVSGYPLDFDEDDLSECSPRAFLSQRLLTLDIIFSPQGKVKRIKMYKDSEGKPKGDALVTYSSSDTASTCCLRVSLRS